MRYPPQPLLADQQLPEVDQLVVEIDDLEEADLLSHLPKCMEFIYERSKSAPVLIHWCGPRVYMAHKAQIHSHVVLPANHPSGGCKPEPRTTHWEVKVGTKSVYMCSFQKTRIIARVSHSVEF